MAIGLRFCRHVLNRNRKDVFLSWLNGQLFFVLPFYVASDVCFIHDGVPFKGKVLLYFHRFFAVIDKV